MPRSRFSVSRAIASLIRRTAPCLMLPIAFSVRADGQNVSAATSLTLSAVLNAVRLHHPLVSAAQARVRAATGTRTTAGVFGNPVLGYQVDNTPFPGGKPIAGLEREAFTTATLPLEPFYQRGSRVKRADAEVRAAQADAAGTRQRIALDATRAFYRVALGQVAAATGRDLAAWLDTVVTYNSARVKEGVTAEADLIRSRLERDRAEAEETMSKADLAMARAELAAYLGDPAVVTIEAMVRELPLSIPVSDSFSSSDVVGRRPDIRAAHERVEAAAAGIAIEHRMLFRQLGATIGTKQTAGTTSMIAGLSLPIPIFDANRGEVERARAEQEIATFDLANQQHVATAEVTGAREAAHLLSDRASLLARGGTESFLSRAGEGRRIALGAYREGAVPLLQVIDAARAWGEARMTFYRTLYAQHQSVLSLIVATGGDLYATHEP